MKTTIINYRKILIFLALFSIAGASFASEGSLPEDSLGTGEYPMEVCSGVWMDNSVANRIELDDDDVITFPRSKVIAPDYDSFALTIHEVNKDGSNHLAYSFFYLCDPEIGDVNGLGDYYEDGYNNNFVCGEGSLGTGDASGCIGSYPGRHLSNAVRMVNWYYDSLFGTGVEQNEPVFCIVGGDIAVSAEREETQHAKTKLDSLHVPWVPVIGNHDTYPYAGLFQKDNDDKYFQEEFLYKWEEAANVFPNWGKQPWEQYSSADGGKIGCQNWYFDIGPNHQLGLDFTKRSYGGGPEPRATLHRDACGDRGTWDWLQDHVQDLPDEHERLIITAHHPLDFGVTLGCRKQFSCAAAKDLVNLVKNNESELAYWFSGHESPSNCWGWGGDDYDDYWAVGKNNGQDTIIEVHFCSAVNRGTKSSTPPWTSVALVRVYSNYVCDFTVSPNPTTTEKEVTFTSTSHFYSAPSIYKYYWDFGDGSAVYSSTSNETYHTYPEYGDYWAKHWVEDVSGSQRSYMIRKIKVEPPLNPPHLWVTIKPPFQPQGGLMSYLSDPGGGGAGDYLAHLKWTFYPVHPYPYTFVNYTGGRVAPNTNSFIQWNDPSDHGWDDDPEPLWLGNLYTWRINANLTSTIENDTTLYDYDYKDLRDDPDPPGGCPEACSYFRCDTTGGDSTHLFLPENTLFPHSEHYAEIRADYLKLDHLTSHTGHYYLNIVENDNETSYIDEAKLWAIDHPEGTEVATSSDGEIYIYSDIATPLSCFDNEMNDRYDEIFFLDDDAFMGNNSSYLTATFPTQDWGNRGLLLGTGIPSEESDVASMPKNYLGIPKKPDGQGGWTPMGEAFARKEPSLWMFDVSDIQDNTFRIDCSGDSCYINYVALVKLEPDEYVMTEAPLDSAVFWNYIAGTWEHSNAMAYAYQTDSVFVVLEASDQLALRYDTVTTTSLVRDYVLETSGFYIPGEAQGGGQSTGPSDLAFSLTIPQTITFTKTVSICYTLPYSTSVKIAVYDVQGRLVNKLVDGEASQGVHELMWNGKDGQNRSVSAGVYFIRMNADDFEQNRKIVLLK